MGWFSVANKYAYRDRALLDMAEQRECLLKVCVPCDDMFSTVAAHSNQSIHGKGAMRKADDHYSVWSCYACHVWLDQGGVPKAEKVAAFEQAHKRQVNAWRQIAADTSEPERFRKAARAAIERLGERTDH